MTKALVLALSILLLGATACTQTTSPTRKVARAPVVSAVNSSFSEAGGVVIPSEKPDAEAVAYASRCSGGGGSTVAMGMSECALIGIKGTPSRVIAGLDQSGRAHNAIWYVEGGRRTVYKFDDDKLIDIIK